MTPTFVADRTVRVVTDRSFVLLKSDERRLWSATAAREDAEAVLLLVMRLPNDQATA